MQLSGSNFPYRQFILGALAPISFFLVVRTASGIPVMVLTLVFSYRFPGWYWARAKGSS